MSKKSKTEKSKGIEVKEDKILIDKYSNIKSINTNNIYVKSHCFKLEQAPLLRNISYNKKQPILQPFEHCHIFHTYDSSGKEMINCNSVGGHYHEITLVEEDGQFKAICSAPISNRGSTDLVTSDKHVHKVTYLKSEEFQARRISLEATKFISAHLNDSIKTSPDLLDAGERNE